MKTLPRGNRLRVHSLALACCPAIFALTAPVLCQSVLINTNMKALHCAMPDTKYRFLGSNQPGQLFQPGEKVSFTLALAKSEGPFSLELQEITTRDPELRETSMEGFTDTGGHALLIGLEGKPVKIPLPVTVSEAPEAQLELKDFPLPARIGTYALILVHGQTRQFLATLARIPTPKMGGTLENTPIFGEGTFLYHDLDRNAAIYERMGIHGSRVEWSWNEKEDGTTDWRVSDETMATLTKHHLQLMVTLGGAQGWKWPFKTVQTPAAVGPDWSGNLYGGEGDWVCNPALFPRYGAWLTTFCQRYYQGGNGALWGFENYNEPWEGGGISGWARDIPQYRALQKMIATAVHHVDPRIRVCAACSIMNTEDKLYSDGSSEFDQYLDVFTDHYVIPAMAYGPMVAKAHGKQSMETETWIVNSEYLLPQVMAQFMASGQDRVSPWHPRVLYDDLPGGAIIPSPTVVASAVFNYFVTGKKFEKLVFQNHLPYVFQFGADQDRDALLIMFGQLIPYGYNEKAALWSQVNMDKQGTITIDNRDRLLKFYDLAGNPMHEGEQKVTFPLNIYPVYIKSARGPVAAAKRLQQALIIGKRPVEILPRDFSTAIAPGALLRVGIHNCYNRPLTGTVTVKTHAGLTLKNDAQAISVAAGDTASATFEVAAVQDTGMNAYPCDFSFTSAAGNAEYAEMLNAAIVPKRTITVDGNLDDWKGIPRIRVMTGAAQNQLTEILQKPWTNLQTDHPQGAFMDFQLAWDENYLYVAARVLDTTPQPAIPGMLGRDENQYFHSTADDTREPLKSWLAKNAPGHSFGEVPFVYADSPETPRNPDLPVIPFRRDRLQIALDVTPGYHDMMGDAEKVPWGFHAVPDTDYEYALYLTKTGSELWRLLAPGVPRIHDWPRQLHGARTTGLVPGAKYVVTLDRLTYTYELAIPRAELADLQFKAGTTFGLALRGGNNSGAHADYAADKAVSKLNGLTMHPYWELSPDCGVRWTLVE